MAALLRALISIVPDYVNILVIEFRKETILCSHVGHSLFAEGEYKNRKEEQAGHSGGTLPSKLNSSCDGVELQSWPIPIDADKKKSIPNTIGHSVLY